MYADPWEQKKNKNLEDSPKGRENMKSKCTPEDYMNKILHSTI